MQDGPHSETNRIDATPPNSRWAAFSATGTFPAGTTGIEVVFYLDITVDFQGGTLFIDDLLLFEGECPDLPASARVPLEQHAGPFQQRGW